MGNKMCKKKVDSVDNTGPKSPSPFDRIISRLHLRPSAWKSDSHLNEKHVKRYEVTRNTPAEKPDAIIKIQPLSKSSDWTEVDLEVPEKEEHIHLRNPKLALIFNKSENGTPTPPPRKHKKNFREKIEAVAKTGLQAFQLKKPVEETVCVKKKINYKCPICDQDESSHNRDHHHQHQQLHKQEINDKNRNDKKREAKPNGVKLEQEKRKKNLSAISLPNYDELKLTVAHFDDADKASSTNNDNHKNSLLTTPNDARKPLTGSTGKLDSYLTRCRSFGSLLPQQLKKLRLKNTPADVESDDSFGGLEDWDLGLIEHYNPKDASLPRPRKEQRSSREVISDLESLIVKEEDMPEQPKPPVRRSESLVKRINREASQGAQNLKMDKEASKSATPPPSPVPKVEERIWVTPLPTEEDGRVEHSSLMRILEQFSVRDKQENKNEDINTRTTVSSNESSLTPSLLEFEKNIITVNSIEDFINAEKVNTDKDLSLSMNKKTLVS